jgi:hypothetical protein
MTTTQEVLTNQFPPFPFFIENPVEPASHDLPANHHNPNSNLSSVQINNHPLPDRCQFTFSDGRRCAMPRSDIHPALCRFHSEREDQLFGDPAPSGVVGAGLDLPELYSACRDLTTAAGVNRALGQIFRLLAQRRISRQEAATFGHLAQLLLRTISLMRTELAVTPGDVIPGDAANVPALDLADSKRELGNTPRPMPDLKMSPTPSPDHETTAPRSSSANLEELICNSRKINTCKIIVDQTIQNQHLHNNMHGMAPSEVPLERTPGI